MPPVLTFPKSYKKEKKGNKADGHSRPTAPPKHHPNIISSSYSAEHSQKIGGHGGQ